MCTPGSGSPSPKNGAKSWDRPSVEFDEFVGQVIAHRLGKYKQPGHPNQISQEDYKELYKKSRRAIIDAERKVRESANLAQEAERLTDIPSSHLTSANLPIKTNTRPHQTLFLGISHATAISHILIFIYPGL